MKFRIALLVVAVLLTSACSDRNGKARARFLSGCIRSGAITSACACAFHRLELSHSPEELDVFHEPMVAVGADQQKAATFQAITRDALRHAAACAVG